MSAEKRNFTDFDNFPGSLNEGTGIYEFPSLQHIDDKERLRVWQIFVRLVKTGKKQSGIDWDLLNEKQVPIKKKYFGVGDDYADLPNQVIAEAWVETGIENGKITRNAPSYFENVGHAGNSNQRNQFQQALIYSRALYLKRMEKGGTVNASGNKKVKGNIGSVMHFPMLAKTWQKGKKYLRFPLYIQPKLDGVRCLIFLKKHNGGPNNVVIYSRTKKLFKSMNYLKELLYPYLNDLYDTEKNQSIFLDGEFYKHGKKLQDISGESRNEKKRPSKKKIPAKKGQKVDTSKDLNKEDSPDDSPDDDHNNNQDNTLDNIIDNDNSKTQDTNKNKNKYKNANGDVNTDEDTTLNEDNDEDGNKNNIINDTDRNEYHIYDCFYPLELDTEYESRKEQLDLLFKGIASSGDEETIEYIKPVETTLVNSLDDAVNRFDNYVKNGYEGIMLRNRDGVYLASPTKSGESLRSNDLVKMKKKFTEEYEVVGYAEGKKGKDKGAIIWIAQTENGKKFNVTPKDITYEKRYQLFKQCKKKFDELYNGRMLTVEYEDLSRSGIPQRAKALVFRDYE